MRNLVPTRSSRFWPTAFAILSAVLVCVLYPRSSMRAFPANLDAGWTEVLAWGITHSAQWGRQLVFTYGPLGFVTPGFPPAPPIYWTTLLLRYAFALVIAWLVFSNLKRLPWSSGLAFLLATAIFAFEWSTASALQVVYPLALLLLEHETRKAKHESIKTHALVAILAAFVSLLVLVKFTMFPLWLAWLPLGVLILWRSPSLVLAFLLASLLAPLAAWFACGQRLANLPLFITHSWEMAAYYAGAMQSSPAWTGDMAALGATLFGLLCAALFAWRERQCPRRMAIYAMFALWLAVSYRAGIVRGDSGHLMEVWAACAWGAPLLIGIWHANRPVKHGTRESIAILLLAVLALTPAWLSRVYGPVNNSSLRRLYTGAVMRRLVTRNIDLLITPQRTHAAFIKDWLTERQSLALPKIDHAVENAKIDVLMNAQSNLLANNLNYDPRPVFQGYAAYSSKLAQLNDTFFRSADAPKWVMLDWSVIDGNYPTSNDPLALIRIIADYHPVLSEQRFLLLERDKHSIPYTLPPAAIAYQLPVSFWSTTAIPLTTDNAWFARIQIHLTSYGKLAALLFRPPVLKVAVTFRNGQVRIYRLARSIVASGFMLTPAIGSNDSYLAWLKGQDEREVVNIRFLQQKFWNHKVFRFGGPLQLYALRLPRHLTPTVELLQSVYPGFNHLPDTITESTRSYRVDGKSVMFLPAPGSLTFTLPSGRWFVHASYGVMPNALTNAACLAAKADGIGIVARIAGQPITADAIGRIDPFDDPHHRYRAEYSHALTVEPGEKVSLSVTAGPSGNGACDWSWVSDVRFTRATDDSAP